MKKILVVAEKDSKNLIALHRALALAKETNVEIDLVGFVHAPGVDSSDILSEQEKQKVRQTMIDEKKTWLKEKLKSIKLANTQLHWEVLWEKSVHLWVIDRCKQKPYDLVIKTGHRSETLMYTPTDWHLIRQCSAPVMIVSSKKWQKKQCIMASVDLVTDTPSKIKLNKQVIRQAQKLSEITGQDVVYVYCVVIPRILSDLEVLDDKKIVQKAKQKALHHLSSDYKKFDIDVDQVRMIRGSVDKAVNRAARKEGADIVVMGTMGRKGIKGKFIGNTAEAVLHNLETDVLTVKI
ncbi:universal stress protein [Pleionea litopenaei]|uniref:Universal stress protein n=1 Tax=Pleionea litopenaei TaxID=3070815 RepID=A0AA51RVM1_9GAMM|nr:universal stress protein [Pleionea sp. HL-JVS1]WMS88395.1 universal stress protein [Pleionea sp. HL-JVS1]